ncbi:hypothetical protein VT73_10355 [Rathayibacter toxicus]|uniref:Uncharacterized protein n=1 Tax=Rathayibacter toxicus TaxID=145458 RepID=A0A0C5BES2_9MICO|nr:hypothetical protein TI83_07410 [Rathayibacter toxicus]KKM44294.1 hypothetical protein VT73_10355 [Rathayibacter toxicus]
MRDRFSLVGDKIPRRETFYRQSSQSLEVDTDPRVRGDRDGRTFTAVTDADRRAVLSDHDHLTPRALDACSRFEQSELSGQTPCECQRVTTAPGDDRTDEPPRTDTLDHQCLVALIDDRPREDAHDSAV